MSQFKKNDNTNFVRASSQTRGNQTQNQNRINFANKPKLEKIKPDFNIRANDFPELIPVSAISNNNVLDMDYKAVTLLEKEVIKPERDEVKSGWVRLHYKNNIPMLENISWEYGEGSHKFHENAEESFNDHALRIIDTMIQNWENYKIDYNNLYGEEAYEKLYGYYKCEQEDDEEIYSDDGF